MDNFLEIIKKRKYLYLIMILFIISILALIGMSKTFSLLEPVKSINITSSNLSYANKEPGSWNIEKSAKWTSSGKARITFDLDTVLKKQSNNYVDIILVLDVSGSMKGEKLNKVKSDSIELVDYLLNDSNNRVGLITFESNSNLVFNLTNDKGTIVNYINALSDGDSTNYYRALVNVDNILKNYTKEEDRDCIVLFLTDGAPNTETPNEVGEYKYLKEAYPYITINGVQYEMGDVVLDPIKTVSDNQYIASMETLNNVLFDASVVSLKYSNIEIVDYLDNNYFNISSIDDIYASVGDVNLEGNKVTWTINNGFISGFNASLIIDVSLKEEFIDVGGTYPTNIKEEIKTKIDGDTENIISIDTPVLADNYMVIYDDNSPNGCSVINKPADEAHSVYTTVKKSEAIPECEGYVFKGWDIVTEDVEKVNDDYFIMPESDVILRAKWGSLTLTKSMDGTVAEVQALYNIMRDNAVLDNVSSDYVESTTGIDFSDISSDTNGKGVYEIASTKDYEYPIYYYRGAVENNNVYFANFCWKIVRTTKTGGVKMIYNGVPKENGTCNGDEGYYDYDVEEYVNTSIGTDTVKSQGGYLSTIGESVFNLITNDSKSSGYTYNDNGTEIDSTIKGVIDDWYQNNILPNYDSYIEDTVYCNDREEVSASELSELQQYDRDIVSYSSVYKPLVRYEITHLPSLECTNNSDKYTKSESIGNGKLQYPVGLLTMDEIMLAGSGKIYSDENPFYLHNGDLWWSLSPESMANGCRNSALMFSGHPAGFTGGACSSATLGVRPVLSLKPSTRIEDGNGTVASPYVIKMD